MAQGNRFPCGYYTRAPNRRQYAVLGMWMGAREGGVVGSCVVLEFHAVQGFFAIVVGDGEVRVDVLLSALGADDLVDGGVEVGFAGRCEEKVGDAHRAEDEIGRASCREKV